VRNLQYGTDTGCYLSIHGSLCICKSNCSCDDDDDDGGGDGGNSGGGGGGGGGGSGGGGGGDEVEEQEQKDHFASTITFQEN